MAYEIYSLKDALEVYSNDRDSMNKLIESLSNFHCKYNNLEVEKFLSQNAIDFEKKDLSRTYILYNKNPFNIVAYFNIAIKSLKLAKVSAEKRKQVSSSKDELTAPAFLLGQIGQIKECELVKYELLDIALRYIISAQKIVGGRSVYLDFEKDREHLFKYYYFKGFRYLSEDEKYMQMMMRL